MLLIKEIKLKSSWKKDTVAYISDAVRYFIHLRLTSFKGKEGI